MNHYDVGLALFLISLFYLGLGAYSGVHLFAILFLICILSGLFVFTWEPKPKEKPS